MTSIQEALHKALAEKRAKVIREQGQVKPSVAGEADAVPVRIKYVRCTQCLQMQSYEAFYHMHGGRPHFCKCKPGDEDLVVFWLEVTTT